MVNSITSHTAITLDDAMLVYFAGMVSKSTVQLLRFPFSLFLMPVYFFALSQVPSIDLPHSILVFIILHLLVYPASNGFNSYMDRDTGPIGGIEKPLPATKQLLVIATIMDLLAIGISLLISWFFTIGLSIYILASRAYSARNIRIKKYPIAGYLLVIICQGCLTWILVYHGCSVGQPLVFPVLPVIAAGLLIGGFYPLTQVYQHEQDRQDGVTTISMLLGYKGTFVCSAVVYSAAMLLLFIHFQKTGQSMNFFILASIMVPVLVYFFTWAARVWKDHRQADFKHAMRMNLLASVCTNLGFIIILTGRYL
jgi:1,4-dihydroxy-2-naphthoate octaprenyltransferase